MSSVDSKLYLFAVNEAKEAVALDGEGKYRQAINKYQRAAESLIQFIKYNKNPIMIERCKAQIEEYLERAKILKSHLSGTRPKKYSSSSPSQGKIGPSEGKEGGNSEGYSEEEQELLDMISGTILTESPEVKWKDIAGLKNCKQLLREAIVLPIMKPELFTGARKPWSGVLLFGPPGCGKTLLAKAAATEVKATFFSASSADLLSKWLGESEKLISALFKVARLRAPSLIFIDEIDSVATKRGSGSESGGERRVKTQLLSEIQGMKSTEDKPLLVLGATNRPWDIDNAMLSRFQKKVYVPLPDLEARGEIFKIHTKGVNTALDADDYIELGVRSEGYTGRDISNVCREVIMIPIRELDMSGILENSDQKVEVRDITVDDFKKTLKKVKPMVDKKELKRYQTWAEEFGEY
ncbi:MAG: AAA family ATPase [Candidatus Lokiarchaeota archaeon]|nr:AAA family ATPase [Candidatus Lokiarchaeota archaeon]MBD3199002.1 AAA family ATPase [Candidatus Lokiarchaeota archaeon]